MSDIDTEAGSDYEVIPVDKREEQDRPGVFRFRVFKGCKDTESMTTSTSSNATSNGFRIDSLMLNSMSNMMRDSDSVHSLQVSVKSPLVFPNRLTLPDDDRTDDDMDRSILEAHGEIKKTLLEAIDQMGQLKSCKEERIKLLDRITTLEGTVDRLSLKNKNLQKVNENGTLFDRRRCDRKSVVGPLEDQEEGHEGTVPVNRAGQEKSIRPGFSKTLFFSILIYSLIVAVAIFYYQTEADKKIQSLEIQIEQNHWNSEQLLARVVLLENKLKISFDEIQKLNNVLYSPYPKDIYALPGDSEDFKEIGCFIRLNSSSVSVCQRLADELEKEAHEKNRLKEKNIVLDAFTKGLISLVLSVTVLYFCLCLR